MRKNCGFWAALLGAALLLAGCQREEVWNYPPDLTVVCGGKTARIGGWRADWEGGPDGTSFVACGDAPTSPDVRDSLTEFTAVPGDTLVLSYDLPPKELRVDLTYDMPVEEWSTTLFEGKPSSGEIAISLPENCGGVYEVSARWDEGEKGKGSTSCGFLVADASKEVAERTEILTEVPSLTIVWNGKEIEPWQGSWEWRVPDGPGSFKETPAASLSPLEAFRDLPVINAKPGDEIILAYSVPPDQIDVWAISGAYVADPFSATSESIPLESGTILVVPEGGTDTIYELAATWKPSLVNGGWSGCAFYVP